MGEANPDSLVFCPKSEFSRKNKKLKEKRNLCIAGHINAANVANFDPKADNTGDEILVY